jgi:phosphate transport system protein
MGTAKITATGGLSLDTPSTPHLEASLQHDIDSIRNRLLEMGSLDKQALTRVFQAFLKHDRQSAYAVILHDQDVDALETELDRACLEFIVRHQPAAGHLRFVYAASKVVSALERVGDYAESMARQVLLLSSLQFDVPTEQFTELADLAIPMLHDAVRAFVDKDADLARSTMIVEPRVNQVRDNLNADLLEWREQGRLPLEALAPLITIARRFERVSDQAMNICEHALYFATGEYLRHMPREGFRVLFVDANHGCLSRMAEAIANRLDAKRFSFSSAGLVAGPADPLAVSFLSEKGMDISRQPSRSLDQVPNRDQAHVLVALGKEAEKALPQRPAKTLGLHWLVSDPSRAQGSRKEMLAAYEQAYQTLANHVRDMVQAFLGNELDSQHETTSAT